RGGIAGGDAVRKCAGSRSPQRLLVRLRCEVAELRPPPGWRSWLVWGIAALFYLTGFYQRVSPAVMTTELMRDFHLGAKSLGSLSGFYFYFYVAMQVPVGVLIDSWGARKLLFWGALSAAAGTFLFGATSNFALACLGRAIVGG